MLLVAWIFQGQHDGTPRFQNMTDEGLYETGRLGGAMHVTDEDARHPQHTRETGNGCATCSGVSRCTNWCSEEA